MKNFEPHLIDNWKYAQKFSIQQKKEEWLTFLEHCTNVKNVLEIGSYDGGTTASLSLICDRLLTIEVLSPRYDTNLIKANCNFTYLVGDSSASDITNFAKITAGEKYDLIFVDGSHVYEVVREDYINYRDLVKSGGMMAFHDIIESEEHIRQDTRVFELWNEIKYDFKHEEIIFPPYEWGGIGIIWMP